MVNPLGKLLATDAEGAPFVKKANGQLISGCALCFIGGWLMGGETGLLLANNENTRKRNVGITVGRAVIANIGLIIGGSSNRNRQKVIYIYNRNEATEGYNEAQGLSLNMGVTDNGLGFSLRF